MAVEQRLRELQHEIELAAAYAPDQYPGWSQRSQETHMADLTHLWAVIRPQLRRDVDEAALIERTLHEMVSAFDGGDREAGRQAAYALLGLNITALR